MINGGLYTANIAISSGGFDNWSWNQFGKSLAVGAVSGAAGAGTGMLTQNLQVYGAMPGTLVKGGIQGITGGLAGGFGNVIMEDNWRAFGNGFVQGFATGFISGGISGGIEGYKNAKNIGANPWTGELYIDEKVYSTVPKTNIPIQPNPERDCYAYSLQYADAGIYGYGHSNRDAAYFTSLTNGAPGADPELVARNAGIIVHRRFTGRVVSPESYENIGKQLAYGREIIGVMSKSGQGHTANITNIVMADKLKTIGGGFKRVLKSTTIWDPITGHVKGPNSFLKIVTLF